MLFPRVADTCRLTETEAMGPRLRGDDSGVLSRRGPVAHRQHAAPDLVFLDGFEQRLEIAFAKTIVALALDELEENRPDRIGRKNLQQHLGVTAVDHALAVDQNAVPLQPPHVLAMLQ